MKRASTIPLPPGLRTRGEVDFEATVHVCGVERTDEQGVKRQLSVKLGVGDAQDGKKLAFDVTFNLYQSDGRPSPEYLPLEWAAEFGYLVNLACDRLARSGLKSMAPVPDNDRTLHTA